jgi:hypothetical protein
VSRDAIAEGGVSAPPVCHPAGAIGGWVVSPASPDYPLFQAAAEALSIVAVRAAAKNLGRRTVWRDLRGAAESPARVRISDASRNP